MKTEDTKTDMMRWPVGRAWPSTSRTVTRQVEATARRGFRPDEIARAKARGDWGCRPLTRGEVESKQAVNNRKAREESDLEKFGPIEERGAA